MLHFDIPGSAPLELEHLVLDYNGTLALDGILLPGVDRVLQELSGQIDEEKKLDNEILVNFGEWEPYPNEKSIRANHIYVSGKTFATFAEALKELKSGQTMWIGPGTYSEPLIVKAGGVSIIGSGHVILDGATAKGKAAIITTGNNITISNIECKNISVPDRNGSCIRRAPG